MSAEVRWQGSRCSSRIVISPLSHGRCGRKLTGSGSFSRSKVSRSRRARWGNRAGRRRRGREEWCGGFSLQKRDSFVGKGFAGMLGANGGGPHFPFTSLPNGALRGFVLPPRKGGGRAGNKWRAGRGDAGGSWQKFAQAFVGGRVGDHGKACDVGVKNGAIWFKTRGRS